MIGSKTRSDERVVSPKSALASFGTSLIARIPAAKDSDARAPSARVSATLLDLVEKVGLTCWSLLDEYVGRSKQSQELGLQSAQQVYRASATSSSNLPLDFKLTIQMDDHLCANQDVRDGTPQDSCER